MAGGALALCATFMTGQPLLATTSAALLLLGAASQVAQVVHVVGTTVLAGRRLGRAAAPVPTPAVSAEEAP